MTENKPVTKTDKTKPKTRRLTREELIYTLFACYTSIDKVIPGVSFDIRHPQNSVLIESLICEVEEYRGINTPKKPMASEDVSEQ